MFWNEIAKFFSWERKLVYTSTCNHMIGYIFFLIYCKECDYIFSKNMGQGSSSNRVENGILVLYISLKFYQVWLTRRFSSWSGKFERYTCTVISLIIIWKQNLGPVPMMFQLQQHLFFPLDGYNTDLIIEY